MVKSPLTTEQEAAAQAVTDTIKDADLKIRKAIRDAAELGVSANEIARRTDADLTGVRGYSRPIILEILGAQLLFDRAKLALQEAGIKVGDGTGYQQAEVDLWEGATRNVALRLSAELRGGSVPDRWNTASAVLAAFSSADLAACQGDSFANMQQVIGDGETVQVVAV